MGRKKKPPKTNWKGLLKFYEKLKGEEDGKPKKRRRRSRTFLSGFARRQLDDRALDTGMLFATAYHDQFRGEIVATRDSPAIGISRGEVLIDTRGYINPSLKPQDF